MQDKVQQVSSAVSYAASGVTGFFGAWTANDVAAIGGLLLACATFVVNWVYKQKHLKLLERSRDE